MKESIAIFLISVFLGSVILLNSSLLTGQSQSLSGSIYNSLEEIAGYGQRPLVLVFISLTCHVCWEELFEMKDFVDRLALPVTLVGISAENREQLAQFARRYSFGYPIIEDRSKTLFRRFRVRLEPFVVVLDSKGEVFHLDDPLLDFETRRDLNKKKILELAGK